MNKTFIAMGHGLALFALSLLQLFFWTLTIVSIALIPVGIGLFQLPEVMAKHRALAGLARRLAHEWNGVEVPSPYLPEPVYPKGFFGQVERCRFLLTDRATWRDLVWGLTDPVVGAFLALMAVALPVYGVEGILMPAIYEAFKDDGFSDWYTAIPVSNDQPDWTAWACVPVGLFILVHSVRWSPKLLHLHGKWTHSLLAPVNGDELAERVRRLTETRSEAIDASAAELRRIERDLHDGAQARLVAMGMSLGAIEHLLERDPEKARLLLAETRATSVKALNELRDLVRGIHPPVLADRGLGDAVKALALDSALAVEVSGKLPRFQPPVESAAYFAVSEILTNAAKHSGARRVWIDLRHEDDLLRIGVTDDGVGGASLDGGTGLRGLERRLAAFDGILALNSPPGGPTLVTMEIPAVHGDSPCAL